jgi:hypothetical protein
MLGRPHFSGICALGEGNKGLGVHVYMQVYIVHMEIWGDSVGWWVGWVVGGGGTLGGGGGGQTEHGVTKHVNTANGVSDS